MPLKVCSSSGTHQWTLSLKKFLKLFGPNTPIDSVTEKAHQRIFFLLLIKVYTSITLSILIHPLLSGLDRPPNRTGTTESQDCSELVPTCTPSRTCTPPEWGNRQETAADPSHPGHDLFHPQEGATEHCMLKQPETSLMSFSSRIVCFFTY